jgi:hypothetical protein
MSPMSKSVSPNAAAIARDFAATFGGKMDQPKIEAVVTALNTATTKYSAGAIVAGAIVYYHVKVTPPIDPPTPPFVKTFNGDAGGVGGLGAWGGGGDVYTDDLARLYRDTASFYFVAGLVYLGVEFFDSNHRLLGHFEGGGIGLMAAGGGTGSWS